jgi:hypothetical protein
MRGVRGSYSSGDENVRKEIERRRQIILNQHYGLTLADDSLLNDQINQSKEGMKSPEIMNSINKNGCTLVKGRGIPSPSYGRGAMLTSDLGGKLKSQRSASMCSDTSSNDGAPRGRGAILLTHISSQQSMQSDRISPSETRDVSDNESIQGVRSRVESLSSKIRSVSEIDSCTESDRDSLSRNERRRQAKLSSANTNPYSDSNNSAIHSSSRNLSQISRNNASEVSKSLKNHASKTSSLQTSRGGNPCDMSSGNESSATEVSIVAASLRGQGEFKRGRLPRDAGSNLNPSRR